MADEELARSNMMGRWSFAFQVPLGGAQTGQIVSLLTLQALEPWEGRPWMVHLNAWQYTGGDVGAGPTPNIPPENLIYSLADVYAHLEYGVDGANETAECDWNPSGVTLQLNTSFIRIGVRWRNNFLNAAPMLRGYLTPGVRFNTLACSPRYTDVVPLANNTITRIRRPPRAVAYRIGHQFDNPGQTYSLVQLGAAGGGTITQVKVDGTHSEAVAVGNLDHVPDAAAGYFPVTSRTQELQITTSLTGGDLFFIEWLLDLG